MIELVKEFVFQNNLIPKGTKTVFAAVSGGVDSCVLLHVLAQIQKEFGFQIEVVHFNHDQRGKSSQEDNAFVFDLAQQFGFKFHSGHLSRTVLNLNENALREERYKFFLDLLKKRKKAILATGHNQDDNIETFLMRMVRGSRLKGLRGIMPRRGPFIRPLMAATRKDIEAYAEKFNILFREDESNRDERFIRNRLRHSAIPFLEENLEPRLRQNVANVIRDINQHYELFQQVMSEVIKSVTTQTANGLALNRKRYTLQSAPLRRGLLEYCISSVIPLNYSLSDKRFSNWEEFINTSNSGGRKEFLGDGLAVADRSSVIFTRQKESLSKNYVLTPGATININNRYNIKMEDVAAEHVKFSSRSDVEFVDAEKTGSRLTVRHWKNGDNFQPLGMSRHRKVSDFFTDRKLNILLKKQVPIVCKSDQIVWIAGYRLADLFKVTKRTKKFYKLTCDEI